VEDVGGDGVEEDSVVRDDDDDPLAPGGAGGELAHEPEYGADREVVGRLVEHQHVGLGEDGGGEAGPHLGGVRVRVEVRVRVNVRVEVRVR